MLYANGLFLCFGALNAVATPTPAVNIYLI